LAAYLIGIVAMIPFVVTVWYTGPVAAAMGGVDIALFIGLLASALAYVAMARSLDLDAEIARAEADSRDHGMEAVSFSGRVAPVET
jgi:NCS1 family nucleobase:cation symporter-1